MRKTALPHRSGFAAKLRPGPHFVGIFCEYFPEKTLLLKIFLSFSIVKNILEYSVDLEALADRMSA